MRVWRFQDADGGGPYNRDVPDVHYQCSSRFYHPSPNMTHELLPHAMRFPTDVRRYGFASEKAALEWFRPVLGNLHEAGQRLVEFEVPSLDVLGPDPRGQVAFSVGEATQVAEHPYPNENGPSYRHEDPYDDAGLDGW